MTRSEFTYLLLKNQIKRRLMRHGIVGREGKFVLLGGLGFTLVALGLPLAAGVGWLALCGGAAAYLGYKSASDPKIRKKIIAHLIAEEYPVDETKAGDLIVDLAQSRNVFVEIAATIAEINRSDGMDAEIERAFADAEKMISLQFSSIERISNLEHVLRVLEKGQKRKSTTGDLSKTNDTARLRDENIAMIKKHLADAKELVQDVTVKLEVYWAQLTNLKSQVHDRVKVQELLNDSKKRVDDLQTAVETQDSISQDLIRQMNLIAG